jgi:hypothetical protein
MAIFAVTAFASLIKPAERYGVKTESSASLGT